MTLNDLERQNREFMDFLAISGCDTSLYRSQDGATLLSLCDPDREFATQRSVCTPYDPVVAQQPTTLGRHVTVLHPSRCVGLLGYLGMFKHVRQGPVPLPADHSPC